MTATLTKLAPGLYEIGMDCTRGEVEEAAAILRTRGYEVSLKTENDGPHIFAEARTRTA